MSTALALGNGILRTRKRSINVDVDVDGDRQDRQNSNHNRKPVHNINADSQTGTRSRKESSSSKYRVRKSSFSSTGSSESDSSPKSRISTKTLLGLVLRSHLKTVSGLKTQLAEMQSHMERSHAAQTGSNPVPRSQSTPLFPPPTNLITHNVLINSDDRNDPDSNMTSILISRLKVLSSEKDSAERELRRIKAELGMYKEGYGRAQGLLVDANEYIREVEDERDELIEKVEVCEKKIRRVARGLGVPSQSQIHGYDNFDAARRLGGEERRIMVVDDRDEDDVVVDRSVGASRVEQSQARVASVSSTELVHHKSNRNDDVVQRAASTPVHSRANADTSSSSSQVNQPRSLTHNTTLPSISQVLTTSRPIPPSINQEQGHRRSSSVDNTKLGTNVISRNVGDDHIGQRALVRFSGGNRNDFEESMGREVVLISFNPDAAVSRNVEDSGLGTERNPIPIQRSMGRTASPLSSASDDDNVNNNTMHTRYSQRSTTQTSMPFPTIPDHIIIRSPATGIGLSNDNIHNGNNRSRSGSGSGSVLDRSLTPGPRGRVIPIAPSFDIQQPSSSSGSSSSTATAVEGEVDSALDGFGNGSDRLGRNNDSRLITRTPVRSHTWTPQPQTLHESAHREMVLPRSRTDDGIAAGGVLGLSGMSSSSRGNGIGANEARERAREVERLRRESQFREFDRAQSPSSTLSSSSPPLLQTVGDTRMYARPRIGSVSSSSSGEGNYGQGPGQPRSRGAAPRVQFPISNPTQMNGARHDRSLHQHHPHYHLEQNTVIPTSIAPAAIPVAASTTTQSQAFERAQSPSSSNGSASPSGTPRRLRRMSHSSNLSGQHHGHQQGNRWSSTTGTSSTLPQILIEPPSRSDSGQTVHTLANSNPHSMAIVVPVSEYEHEHGQDYNLLSPEHALQPLPFERPLVEYDRGAIQIPLSIPASTPSTPMPGMDYSQPIFIPASSGTPSPNMSVISGLPLDTSGIPLSTIQHELPPGFVPMISVSATPNVFPGDMVSGTQFGSPDSRARTSGNRASGSSTRTMPRGPRLSVDTNSTGRPVIPIARSEGEPRAVNNDIRDEDEDDVETPRITTRTTIPSRSQEASQTQPILSPIPISISDRESDISEVETNDTRNPNATTTRDGSRRERNDRDGGDYFSIRHHQPRNLTRFTDPPAIRAFS